MYLVVAVAVTLVVAVGGKLRRRGIAAYNFNHKGKLDVSREEGRRGESVAAGLG